MRAELIIRTEVPDPPLGGWIEPLLVQIAHQAGLSEGHLTVALVDDAEMADLNREFRRRDRTTDVLTFDLRQPAGIGPVEADVVICLDEAVRQSRIRGHEVRLEVLLYAVHGLLHLMGYDDADPDESARMHRREDELLVGVGLPAIYAGIDPTRGA